LTKRLEGMRRNLAGNWTINDIEALSTTSRWRLALQGISSSSRRDSDGAFQAPHQPVYIRTLVAFVDAVRESHGPT
jgi:hypothetical protein